MTRRTISAFLRHTLFRFVASPAPIPPSVVQKRLCIYKCDGFGDFLLATSTVRRLVEKFGEENTVFITSPPGAEIASAEFPRATCIIHQFATPKGIWKKWRLFRQRRQEIARYHFAMLVCLRHQRNSHDNLTLGWIRADRSFAITGPAAIPHLNSAEEFAPLWSDPVASFASAQTPDLNVCLELEMHRSLASAVLARMVSPAEITPSLTQATPTSGNYAVISPLPGAVTNSLRNIPIHLLQAGLFCLAKHRIERVFLCGSTGQREALEILAIQTTTPEMKVETTTPGQFTDFVRLVAGAQIVFSAETGTAHLAATLDKPAVILIGGGHYGQFAPWRRSERQIWLTNKVPCFHCGWNCCHPEPICITQISPSSIRAALDQVLLANLKDERSEKLP